MKKIKVLFIYPESGYNTYNNISFKNGRYYHGIAILSAVIKKMGHITSLHHILNEFEEDRLNKKIIEFKPDLICTSSTTHMMTDVIRIGNFLHKDFKNIPSLIGGMIVSIEPELINKFKGFDAAVIGDGEIALSDIVKRLSEGKEDIFIKSGNIILKGQDISKIRARCMNIDEIPFGDRELFEFERLDDYEWFKRLPMLTSRGCPFKCPFCANSVLADYYNKGDYVRFRSVDNICCEIEENIKKYPHIQHIQFQSDMFFKDMDWLEEFKTQYKTRINLPFHCLLRIEQISEEVLELLKQAGCELILMGIESGDELLRKRSGKDIKYEKIVQNFKLVRDFGIKTGSFNILGLPGETIEGIIELFKINSEISPDLAQISIYYPYKNTPFYKEVENYIEDDKKVFKTYFEKSLLKEKYVVNGFYYYYEHFLSFVELYKENSNPLKRKLLDFLIRHRLISQKKLSNIQKTTFRIIF